MNKKPSFRKFSVGDVVKDNIKGRCGVKTIHSDGGYTLRVIESGFEFYIEKNDSADLEVIEKQKRVSKPKPKKILSPEETIDMASPNSKDSTPKADKNVSTDTTIQIQSPKIQHTEAPIPSPVNNFYQKEFQIKSLLNRICESLSISVYEEQDSIGKIQNIWQYIDTNRKFMNSLSDTLNEMLSTSIRYSNMRQEITMSNEPTYNISNQLTTLKELNKNIFASISDLQENKQSLNNKIQDQNVKIQNIQRENSELSVNIAELKKIRESDHKNSIDKVSSHLSSFWKSRDEFYRNLHRGIIRDTQNKKRLMSFRKLSLETDIKLLESFGCEILFKDESISFMKHAYDGSLHSWYDEEYPPVMNGEQATIFLPGWKINNLSVKPFFGHQEVTNQ